MLTVITDPDRLASAQALFTEPIRPALPQRIICTVSGVGGGFETEAAYSPELNLWYAMQRQDKKCWNGFGIGEPLGGKKVSIAAEINFPAEGLNRRGPGGPRRRCECRKRRHSPFPQRRIAIRTAFQTRRRIKTFA